MKQFQVIFLAVLMVCVLSACDVFDPQWMGVWVDDSDQYSTVTLDLGKDEGTVTVENTDLMARFSLTIVKGPLDGDEDTMTATITYLYAVPNNPPGAVIEEDTPTMIEIVLATLGIGRTNSCSYRIEENILIISGQLINVLTENRTDTLTAVKR
jgi:hypothetical protein